MRVGQSSLLSMLPACQVHLTPNVIRHHTDSRTAPCIMQAHQQSLVQEPRPQSPDSNSYRSNFTPGICLHAITRLHSRQTLQPSQRSHILFFILTLLCSHSAQSGQGVETAAGRAEHHIMRVLSLLVFVLCAACAYASDRALKVSIKPVKAPITRPFDPRLALSSADISPTDARVQKQGAGCDNPEQIHLTYWSSTSVLVSWASCDASLGPDTQQAAATDSITSVVYYGKHKEALKHTAEGVATTYSNDYSSVGGVSYASPVLHHVLLTGLKPGRKYHYRVADSSGYSSDGSVKLAHARKAGKLHSFTLPAPATFPLRIGVIGDPGQTYNTSDTLERLTSSDPQLLLLLGDFAYADNWFNATAQVVSGQWGTVTYQPKWDCWGRLFEPLLSRTLLMHTNGNHEIEPLRNGDRNNAYNHRFPTPQTTGHDYNKGPTSFSPVSADKPFNNLYYAVELPGVYKYIALTSYAPNQTFSHQEEQYTWLEQELSKVDRTHTPWVIVAVHAPFYHTYLGHYKEVECMRQAYEPLLVRHQVDIVLSGHVHAYERTRPVVNYQPDDCGPMYLTVGDGGNIEGIYRDYVDQPVPPPYCENPENFTQKLFSPRYQPQACFSWQNGEFCPQQQPEWSAYREPSFGYGTLELLSPTRARWTWRKNQWPAWEVGDEVTITRGGGQGCEGLGARGVEESAHVV